MEDLEDGDDRAWSFPGSRAMPKMVQEQQSSVMRRNRHTSWLEDWADDVQETIGSRYK